MPLEIADFTAEIEAIDSSTESDDEFRFKEFRAFIGSRPDIEDRHDFDIKPIQIKSYKSWFQSYFSRVVLVPQLRETRALVGFSRLKPCSPGEEKVSMERNKYDWLPAMEVRGEGVFIEFRDDKLLQWEILRKPLKRAQHKNQMIQEAVLSGQPNFTRRKNVDERFLLIHSFAHLVIRQLAFECGYDAGSLKERVFVGDSEHIKMNGVLIYTASGDAEGSLGGLVERGKPGLFERTVSAALNEAQYCSNDPICLETTKQGHQGYNAAACHSCLLLPETCCEHNNLLLDRTAIIGSVDGPETGYFFNLDFS
ncbi:MAG: DUF1998 domain-containing protein [Paracoccaceae bacterium]